MRNYDNVNYANERLVGTICMVNKQATNILAIKAKTVAHTPLRTGVQMNNKIEELDITPPTLGYINYNNIATYATRMPVRKYKQGLVLPYIHLLNGWAMREIPSINLADMLEDSYPSYQDTIDVLHKKKDLAVIAFSHDFAMCNNLQLYHRGIYHVGEAKKNGNWELFDQYHWVAEGLEVAINAH